MSGKSASLAAVVFLCMLFALPVVSPQRQETEGPTPEMAAGVRRSDGGESGGRDTRTIDLGGGIEMELVRIPSGTFQMGAVSVPRRIAAEHGGEPCYYEDERPAHEVFISRGFWMGKCEVTNAQYCRYKSGHSSSDFRGISLDEDDQPAVYVTWDDASEFCRWLSVETGQEFRLPTEAEWEYACRAGTTAARYWGDDDRAMGQHANSYDRTGEAAFDFNWDAADTTDGHTVTAPVGQFKPNQFGLHDMLGNVSEWCQDWYDADYYAASPLIDPCNNVTGSTRLMRGGSWNRPPRNCRAASRQSGLPTDSNDVVGFRVACW